MVPSYPPVHEGCGKSNAGSLKADEEEDWIALPLKPQDIRQRELKRFHSNRALANCIPRSTNVFCTSAPYSSNPYHSTCPNPCTAPIPSIQPTNPQLIAFPQMTGSIIVINESANPCHVFVSKFSVITGNDGWFTLAPGQRTSWGRNGWELVAFKNRQDTDRAGVYVAANSTVVFRSLREILVG
ncbi:hypothetical protein C8Q77DRAFT_1159820 [Trametes polyzona]|nr:hypothetical protein C8Q77DRAFT_1159820 [Trametes polyzona]